MSEASSHPPTDGDPNGPQNPSAVQPGLMLVATPIGNMADMSLRGIAVLRAASLVLCEDTRVTAHLFAAHNISTRLMPLHDHNEDARIPQVLERLGRGEMVALVSDAGTPLISDPGYRLVRAAIAAGHAVRPLPGANAALSALQVSGLPPHPYLFAGFAPPRAAARRASYQALRAAEQAGLRATLVWHEAPHRLAEALADLALVFGPRPAAVARELTKRFEEVRRGTLAELAAGYATTAARGEITVVVGPAPDETDPVAEASSVDEALRAALGRMSLRDAAAAVATATGAKRKAVYARALALAAGCGAEGTVDAARRQSSRDPGSRESETG